jgi:hypothetical protein
MIIASVSSGLVLFPWCMGYIGPGAGFAFLGSFLLLFAALALALLSLAALPARLILGFLRTRRRTAKPQARRVVVLGMDGLDPRQLQRRMEQGQLPGGRMWGQTQYLWPSGETEISCAPVAT